MMYFLSVLMIFISSYLILSVISQKTKRVYGFLYFLLIAFSQIILSFEVLSLFSLINKNNFLICNFIFLLSSCLIFTGGNRKFYIPEIKSELKKILFALKSDKLLMFCAMAFLIFTVLNVIYVTFFPIRFLDALDYYFTRTVMWLQQGNINRFITPDSRELIMPVNFDMLYMLHIMFTGSEKGTGIFPFISYSGTCYVLYCFVKELKFSIRQALWSVFAFSSFIIIAVSAVVPCSETAAGGLLLGSIFLFLISVKYNDKTALLFSALCFAVSFGVKTTSLMAIPSILLLAVIITLIYKPEGGAKKLSMFCLYTFLFFAFFSSYNYILNFLQYSNPLTSEEHKLINASGGGIKSYICSMIKYFFMFFDASNIDVPLYNETMTKIQNKTLSILSLNDAEFPSEFFPKKFEFNTFRTILSCALGITGIFVFIPSFIKTFFVVNKKKERLLNCALALSLVINISVIAAVMAFTKYNNKYLITFSVLAMPILAYSYIFKNKIYKIFVSVSVIFCLLTNCVDFYSASIFKLKNKEYFEDFEEQTLYNTLKNYKKGNVGMTYTQAGKDNFSLHKLFFDGFTIINIPPETVKESDLRNTDLYITGKEYASSSVIIKQGEEKNADCEYIDYKKRKITGENKNKAVSVKCKIPFEYLEQNGFKEVTETENYKVFQKTDTERT